MTATYLRDVQTDAIKPRGTNGRLSATLISGPAATNWWVPKFVKVSIANASAPWHCALYRSSKVTNPILGYGSIDTSYLDSNALNFLDSTDTAVSDITGVVSGLMLAPGESLIGVFTPGSINPAPMNNNSEIAVMEVYGTNYSSPPNPELLQSIGPRFNGRPTFPPSAPNGVFAGTFTNPGQSASVAILTSFPANSGTGSSGQTYYLFDFSWLWNGTLAASAGAGQFEAFSASGGIVIPVMPDNPTDVTQRHMAFRGMNLDVGAQINRFGNGLRWTQIGNAAANQITCFYSLTAYSTTLPL